MKPLLISSGEPAGIGPDLCIALAGSTIPLIVLGDKTILQERAKQLGLSIVFEDYKPGVSPNGAQDHLTVLSLPCPEPIVVPGKLNPKHSSYVIKMLTHAMEKCIAGEFAGLVTAPVHKGVINQAGYAFTGHTEFFAEQSHVDTVVMVLMCDEMKVALVTTHLPLRMVADAISQTLIIKVILKLHQFLQQDLGISQPKIYVAGLNPHAGEDGYLGREEIEIISPSLRQLKEQGVDVVGPFPADTMFQCKQTPCDAYVAMYHDQGLAVLKYAGFGKAVNVTLGLPFIRTSVDHGTALDLAGTGRIDTGSMKSAVTMAAFMAKNRTGCKKYGTLL